MNASLCFCLFFTSFSLCFIYILLPPIYFKGLRLFVFIFCLAWIKRNTNTVIGCSSSSSCCSMCCCSMCCCCCRRCSICCCSCSNCCCCRCSSYTNSNCCCRSSCCLLLQQLMLAAADKMLLLCIQCKYTPNLCLLFTVCMFSVLLD